MKTNGIWIRLERKSEQEEGHNLGGKGVWKPRSKRRMGEVKRFKWLRAGAFRFQRWGGCHDGKEGGGLNEGVPGI